MDPDLVLIKIEIAAAEGKEKLDLSDQGLTNLPPEIGKAETLIELDLGQNSLESLPAEIGQLQALQSLDLWSNQLRELPPEIIQLPNLQSLTLSDNQLSELPPEIGQLQNLQSLYLRSNQLRQLPPEIGQLQNLEALYLRSNQLRQLPLEIGQLQNLQSLDLMRNPQSELPPEIIQLPNLQSLSLSGNQLSELTPEIGQLQNLQRFYLRSNRLRELPPEIIQLQNLQSLDLRSNRLSELPPEIGQLQELQSLDLTGNQLSELPPEIGQMQNLQSLTLSGNQLSELPPDFGQLQNLRSLKLSFNQLSELPSEIVQLQNLQSLSLNGNQLHELPPEIGQLLKLQRFYLRDNQLRELPSEIGQLQNLEAFEFDENPLRFPPPEVISQGWRAVLIYLGHGFTQQWVSKMMVVGQGGVGKTQVLRSLLGEPFDEKVPTTHGIDIRTLSLPYPGEPQVSMQLNAWDFGGQEIYHATHKFFLTNRSLFLLVWNARHGYEQGKLYYWLDAIQARAPESPVIIVATHIDQRDADLPLSDIRKAYPQVVGQAAVSNSERTGFEILRALIIETAVGLPLMGERWPTPWLETANALRASQDLYVTPNQLSRRMADFEIPEKDAPILARWLHELGEILYFIDEDDLKNLVVLKPQWVSKYISDVLESEEVIEQDGVLTRNHMDDLWKELDAALHEHFLRLMEQFDLSYRTLDNKEISLVVERLPLDPPDFEAAWDNIRQTEPCREIAMHFELSSMQAGLPTWFIARSHRFTTHTHWRNGALFTDDRQKKTHLALVQAFPHNRSLHLSVRGPNPHNFFALMHDGLELTLKRYPGLEITRLIPCPGHHGEPCPHKFRYDQLQKRLEHTPPKLTVECSESFEELDVRELIFGIGGSTLDTVLDKMRDAAKQDEVRHRALLTLLQREFSKTHEIIQATVDSWVPNVFTLKSLGASGFKNLFIGDQLELQLYCQEPGEWHPARRQDAECGSHAGCYRIDNPQKWLRGLAPYLEDLMKLLKFVTPFVAPWLGIMDDTYAKQIANEIKLTGEIVKVLPSIAEGPDLKIADRMDRSMEPEPIQGAPLRTLRMMLEEKDPQQVWGGLERVLTPEGHYLWLCKYHAEKYKD